jgi:GNAT superfamily N-acetyltransferase
MTQSITARTDSANADFRELVVLLDQDLRIRDGEDHDFYAAYNKIDSLAQVVVAYCGGVAVGCGAFKRYADRVVEIKRMFVRPEYRGRGIAGEVLAELEVWAGELGFTENILETGKKQPEAIRLYQKSGYTVIPNFGQYQGIDNSVCMQKKLRNPE